MDDNNYPWPKTNIPYVKPLYKEDSWITTKHKYKLGKFTAQMHALVQYVTTH